MDTFAYPTDGIRMHPPSIRACAMR